MAKLYHPDVPGTGDNDRFLAVREAADALSTPEGRSKWSRQQPRPAKQRSRERAEARSGFWEPRAAAAGRGGGSRQGGGPSRPHSWVDWEEADWMDEDDFQDAEAWDVEWGSSRKEDGSHSQNWEAWAPWNTDSGYRERQPPGGRGRQQGGGKEGSLERQTEEAQDQAHARHQDREHLWKERLRKAKERAKATQKLGWSDQLSKLKSDNFERRGREKLRWAKKANQTRDERASWKEAAAQRWVERFRLAEEESNRRREETARVYAEKIRRAKEEARKLREERTALERARYTKWRHMADELQEETQRVWSDAFQEAKRANWDTDDEESHWVALHEKAQQSHRTLPKKWSARFRRLMREYMDKQVTQTESWERSFRKAMRVSSDKASEDSARWQDELRKTVGRDLRQRAEWNQKQQHWVRVGERKAQQWRDWEIQKWAKRLRKAEDEALRKEREVERDWAQKLLEAEEEALEVLTGK